MTTALDIVTGALKHLRILDGNASAAGPDASIALERLNDMLHAWALNGVDINHVDLELNDYFPLEDKYREGVKAMLAIACLNDFDQADISPIVRSMADNAWLVLLDDYNAVEPADFDNVLIYMPSETLATGGGYSGS